MSAMRPSDYEDWDTLTVSKVEGKRQRKRPVLKKRSDHVISDEILRYAEGETGPVGAQFQPSFTGSLHERQWILNYLGYFYDDQQITDVLSRVKGGKEANVYCCAAHPATGLDLLAAKVYRPRVLRHLRNDARYRQGRAILDERGKVVRDDGLLSAMKKKSEKGKEAVQVSWVEHEYQALLALHRAGVEVPRPISHANHTILMEYVGDVHTAAPALHAVRLDRAEAAVLFERLLRNIELMLAAGRIHGDLSAYNVLYWEGEIRLIDFPQVVDPRTNPDAPAIFERDVVRVCQYFARYHIEANGTALAADLWSRYGPPAAVPIDEVDDAIE